MLTTVMDIVRLCILKTTPTIETGAEISETRRSAVQSASKSGFLTRAVDCEQSDISSVELPTTPPNITMP